MQTYSEKDIPRIIKALTLYYSRLDTRRAVTFNYACSKYQVNSPLVTDFIINNSKGENPIGMPSDGDEAREYLPNLRKLSKKLQNKT